MSMPFLNHNKPARLLSTLVKTALGGNRLQHRQAWLAVVFALLVTALGVWLLLDLDPEEVVPARWLTVAIITVSCLLCLARAASEKRERLPWLLIGLGLIFRGAGLIYAASTSKSTLPFPSWSSISCLAFYIPVCLALWLLARSRLPLLHRGRWLDGLIAASTVATIIMALLFAHILAFNDLSQVIAAALALGDLLLLGLLAAVFGASGWRLNRTFIFIALSLLAFTFADIHYLVVAAHPQGLGHIFSFGWPAAAICFAYAAWQRPQADFAVTPISNSQKSSLLVPTACAIIVRFTLLLSGNLTHLRPPVLFFGVLTLVAVTLRLWQIFAVAQKMASRMTVASFTDELTGIGNRRQLLSDLESVLADLQTEPRSLDSFACIIFDLNGFKDYNDTFGHPAGDNLLSTLARRLDGAVAGHGHAYRIGGDEFCALITVDEQLPTLISSAVAALSERGNKFSVDAAYGMVTIPEEGSTVSAIMSFADERMYAQKAGGRASIGTQMRDTLLCALGERDSALGVRIREVGARAQATAEKLGLSSEQVDEVLRAAELHDIGKVAIPDSILLKDGPLNEEEWALMRLHTTIGQRILAAAPALAPVGRLVRSCHEAWDGSGYPDGLVGENIPLGSRIVAVANAYEAMISDRVYQKGMSKTEAQLELRRCAGGQFDPRVVAAFLELLTERDAENITMDLAVTASGS